ncbi:MAG: ribosome maturation factor RimM [Gammaproteobacteria bacterium]|nr:ribosome maturation factor RimM [Gammaproteobacteria bacterium]
MVIVGQIGGVYGIKGWVRVASFTQPMENLLGYAPWHFRRGSSSEAWQVADIVECKAHRGGYICSIGGVSDRDAAAAFKGALIGVELSELPALDGDEYYWRDLEGLSVRTISGEALGTVERVMETGANDVLVVRDDTRERLLPFVRQVVVSVDVERGRIVADWDPEF